MRVFVLSRREKKTERDIYHLHLNISPETTFLKHVIKMQHINSYYSQKTERENKKIPIKNIKINQET